MNKPNLSALALIGLAWSCLGMGYMSLQFHFLPEGAALVTETLGLFGAGVLTGVLLLSVLDNMETPVGRWLVVFGYLLFAPLGIMAGLLATGPYEPVHIASSVSFALMAPVLIAISAIMAVGLGLTFTGGLAVAAHRLAHRD